MASQQLVLVTGGTGFVGVHCIVALLREGYRVRTTLRSLKRADEVREMLKVGGIDEEKIKGVEFAVADLMKDDGWNEACSGCTYVLHVASPFPAAIPKDSDELIVPAREGTLRALRAAKQAGSVKRVVITGSFAAIGYGHPPREKPFTEDDWSNLDSSDVPPYQRSKTIAEKAAWDWIEKEGGSLELTVINPGGIFGPILGKDYATSIELISRLINGEVPGLPQLSFSLVDVRDVADLHLKAMTDPKANGQRFLCICDGPAVQISEIAKMLKTRFGDKAKRVPTRVVPNFVLTIVGWFDPAVRMIVPELGKPKTASNEKAKEMLGWRPRSVPEAVNSSAESLIQFGLIKGVS